MRAWIFAPALALVLATAAAACVGDDPVGSQDAGATPADASTAPTDAPTNVPDTSTPGPDAGADTSAPVDGGADTGPGRRCDPAKTFDAPTFMATVSSAFDEASFSMTRDELTAFMHRENTGAPNTSLLQTTRARVTDAFAAPTETNLAVVNTPPGSEYSPTVSPDGLVLYFHRQTAGGIGVFVATRGAAGAPFANQGAVTVGGTALSDALSPHLSADGQTLYFSCIYGTSLAQVAIPAVGEQARLIAPCEAIPNLKAVNPTDPNNSAGGVLAWNGHLIVSGYSTYDAAKLAKATRSPPERSSSLPATSTCASPVAPLAE